MTANMSARAIVSYEPVEGAPNWKLEDVTLRPLQSNELLIRLVATGICHTDLIFGAAPVEMGGSYPKVLGHEGAGYVEKIGTGVKSAKDGDAVLLSFRFCGNCKDCKAKHPSFCQSFAPLNYGGEENFTLPSDSKASGSFFGQSSFSSYAIVKESSVVNVTGLVKDEEELKMFAPMGCGFQTGVGTVERLCGAGEEDAVVIMGLGGVGLSAIMAAKMLNCHTIIAVDRITERLEIAKTFGATHTINTSDSKQDIVEEVKALTGGCGSSITVDTTGNMGLIGSGMDFTANRGQMVILGVPPMDGSLSVHLITFMQTGKQLRGVIEGDVTPSEYIPKMIQWFREGKLPINKIVRSYPVNDFKLAISDMTSGITVKPILIW